MTFHSAAPSATDKPAHVHPHAPIIAVIGDGQLARMMQTSAIELGVNLRIYAESSTTSAAQVSTDLVVGDFTNLSDLRAALADVDVITFDHEHVPNDLLTQLVADGKNVQPRPEALINAQDKLIMRTRLAQLGAPVPAFTAVESAAQAEEFFREVNGGVCVKARRGGYDGHGVWFPETSQDLADLVNRLLAADVAVMVEQKVDLSRELSIMATRTPSGEFKAWPVVESVQKNGVCVEAQAPAAHLDAQLLTTIEQLAATIAEKLNITGVFAVELFETVDADGRPTVLVNELAMRPHNTGHWTQDGCVTNQFEQHLRAVTDYPLGDVRMLAPVTAMVNVLGAEQDPELPMFARVKEVWKRFPAAKIHLYGKDYRAGRKLGHVNIVGDDPELVRSRAQNAAEFLVNARWLD